MPNLKSYQMDFSAITPKAMDNNDIKLDKIQVCAEDENDLISQLRVLKRSNQTQHISSLSILCVVECFTSGVFRCPNTSLDNNYIKLVKLHINATYSSQRVLVDILKNVPLTLESIEFSSVNFDDFQERTMTSVSNSRVKELNLTLAWDKEPDLDNWNNGLESILNACPRMENFTLTNETLECDEVGAIKMNFRKLERL